MFEWRVVNSTNDIHDQSRRLKTLNSLVKRFIDRANKGTKTKSKLEEKVEEKNPSEKQDSEFSD